MKMTYAKIRERAKTGDVLLVEGKGFVSGAIRVVTGETYSHVGMLLWIGENLFVSEFKEFKGYRLIPASIWVEDVLDDGNFAYFGSAPEEVVDDPQGLSDDVFKYRAQSYGYLSLFKVWWAQVFNVDVGVRRLVCSTYVQAMWLKAGHILRKTADPGDIAHECDYVSRIQSME